MGKVAFKGRLAFCSNFYPRSLRIGNVWYRTREHAFQARKFLDPEISQLVANQMSAKQAKWEARRHKAHVRKDWYNVSIQVMEEVVQTFFDQWPDMQKRLLATEGEHLEEENNWGDRFWGTVDGQGENHLGKILMRTRSRLRDRQTKQGKGEEELVTCIHGTRPASMSCMFCEDTPH